MQGERIPHREAAEYIGVSENTLSVWRCTKRFDIPYIKVGSKVFYWKKDLDTFLESQTVRVVAV